MSATTGLTDPLQQALDGLREAVSACWATQGLMNLPLKILRWEFRPEPSIAGSTAGEVVAHFDCSGYRYGQVAELLLRLDPALHDGLRRKQQENAHHSAGARPVQSFYVAVSAACDEALAAAREVAEHAAAMTAQIAAASMEARAADDHLAQLPCEAGEHVEAARMCLRRLLKGKAAEDVRRRIEALEACARAGRADLVKLALEKLEKADAAVGAR